MVVYVNESGSDRQELIEELVKEGVSYKERSTQTTREVGGGSWRLVEVQANLPEVYPVPPEFAQSEGDVRAWRLPSGRLIITDLEGSLEQIASAPPSYGR
jgi:hypothetical protein